jgi:hypothetical protein
LYLKGDRTAYANEEERSVQMYGRLQNLAYSALAEVCFKIFTFNRFMLDEFLVCNIMNLKPLLCFRKSLSKIHRIFGRNHGRHLYGNLVEIEKMQKN